MIGQYDMSALEPPSEEALTLAAERYEASDEFEADALGWALDNPTQWIIEASKTEYRESERYRTAVEDIAAGERRVA